MNRIVFQNYKIFRQSKNNRYILWSVPKNRNQDLICTANGVGNSFIINYSIQNLFKFHCWRSPVRWCCCFKWGVSPQSADIGNLGQSTLSPFSRAIHCCRDVTGSTCSSTLTQLFQSIGLLPFMPASLAHAVGSLLGVYATVLSFPRLCKRFVFPRRNNRGISSCSCQEEDIVKS